jgi:hypothetical protein
MEDINEKLKILNYEEKFKPMSRHYFAAPNKTNQVEQFHLFIALVKWLVVEKLEVKDFTNHDQYDDPHTIATDLCMYNIIHGINDNYSNGLEEDWSNSTKRNRRFTSQTETSLWRSCLLCTRYTDSNGFG